MKATIVWLGLCALLHACSTGSISPARQTIEAVRGLSADGTTPKISGIARTATSSDGRIAANVLFVHGIGWTQRDRRDQWVLREADALRQVLTGQGVSTDVKTERRVTRLCKSTNPRGEGSSYAVGGLQINGGHRWSHSDDPMAQLLSTWIACLDRVEIDLGERGVVNLYRLLWDDLIYDAYQYPRIGYDDAIRSDHEGGGTLGGKVVAGYEDLNALRSSVNAQLKAEMVSYGLSEAALYLGPLGELMRQGVAAAICAVIDEAGGRTHAFEEIDRLHAQLSHTQSANVVRDHRKLCEYAEGDQRISLTIVSESLGSKVVFDTLRGVGLPAEINKGLRTKLSKLSNDSLETFLLANQVPVLATGAMPAGNTQQVEAMKPHLRFVAVTEVNDLLSYELVPYFEHMYVLRCRNWSEEAAARFSKECEKAGARLTLARLENIRRQETRHALVKELGYEVVDVRVRYAKPYSKFVPDFVDPLDSHTGYLRDSDVQRLLVCGLSARGSRDVCRGVPMPAGSPQH